MEEEKEFELEIKCFNCGEINVVYGLDPFEEAYIVTLDTEETFNESVDYIFGELVKDGFAPNSSAIRQVLRYFSQFVEKKAEEMFKE